MASIIEVPTVDRIPTFVAVDYYESWEAIGASTEQWRCVRELVLAGATQAEAFVALRVTEAMNAE